MSLTIDEIVEILNEMREQNKINAQDFEKGLTGLNHKLEMLADDNETEDMIRLYIAELKKSIEDKHNDDKTNSDEISSKIDSAVSDVSTFREEFHQSVSSNLENSSKILNRIAEVTEIITGMEEVISEKSHNNFFNLKSFLEELDSKLKNNFETLSAKTENQVETEDLQKVSDEIKEIQSMISSNADTYKTTLINNIQDIKDYINEIQNSASSFNTENETGLNVQLEALEILKHNFETSFSDIDLNIRNLHEHISNIQGRNDENLKLLDEIKSSSNAILFLTESVEHQSAEISEFMSSIKEITENRSEIIENKLEECANLTSDLKDLIITANQENPVKFDEFFQKVDNSYANLVSENNFSQFRAELNDFVQRLIDNSNILNADSTINREKLTEIAEKINSIEPVDYSYDMEQLSSKIDSLFELLNSNEVTNKINEISDNILQLNNLVETSSNSYCAIVNEHFKQFEEKLAEISSNEDFENFRNDFSDFVSKLLDNTHLVQLNAETNKEHILQILEKINEYDMSYDLNNIAGSIDEIKAFFENNSKMNYEDIVNAIQNAKEQILEKVEIVNNNETLQNIIFGFNDLSANIQALQNKNNIEDIEPKLSSFANSIQQSISSDAEINFGEIKNSIEKISKELSELKEDSIRKNDGNVFTISSGFDNIKTSLENMQSVQNEYLQDLKDVNSEHIFSINSVNDNISVFKTEVDETIKCLKEYISELDESSKTAQISNNDKFSTKLLDLESQLITSSQEFEQKFELLQCKLTEFAHIVENSASDTEGKIASTLENIASVQAGITEMSESLQKLQSTNSEKFAESLALLDAGIDNIVVYINNINDTLANQDFSSELKDEIQNLDAKFDSIINELQNLKNDTNDDTHDKIALLQNDLENINQDIVNALQCKCDEIIRALEPVKTGIDEFVTMDFDKLLNSLKSQLELSFLNFGIDIRSEISENTTSISNLEKAYKETFNQISSIEECVTETLQNNIELLNASVESSTRNIKDSLSGKLEEALGELKAYIEVSFNNTQSQNSIEKLRNELLEKINDLFKSNEDISLTNNVISANITAFNENLSEKAEKLQTNITDSFSTLNTKIDILTTNDNDDVIDMLNSLHNKIDVLAMSDETSIIEDEIEDIKELINEHRKSFEESNDEKTAAIDKYLRDVLLKLDSVDLEKNSEDIKESITSALAAMFEQISFIEESEDIKDFVEDKTDEINKALNEVQTQLKQIASQDDDFDYTYTLQDVESDIARLRLAINNMSGHDFEGFSDDIKKIIKSVETLENSLTHDQIIDLKNDIEKLNDDIVSISSRTNKLLLTSDESSKALNESLNNFSNIICKLEDRINYLDNTAITERIEHKTDNIQTLTSEVANSQKILNQAMTYLGEWIDSASTQIDTIEENTSVSAQINENISSINEHICEISEIKSEIKELKTIVPDKDELLNRIEDKFISQEERINALEDKLTRVITTLEEKDDTMLNRKVDKIEKLLNTLTANIEKLTAYVDE